jgi:hypothetical protein
MKYIKGFFTFWFDFIVGDAWEVAVGVLITLVVLFAAVQMWGSVAATLGAFLLPLAVIAVLTASFRRTSQLKVPFR